MRLRDICGKCNIFCPDELGNTEITGISADSRRVREGYAFVCISGEKHDGNSYIDKAILHGARIIVSERDDIAPNITLKVDNARRTLAEMMNVLCGSPAERMKFIAVTGTNGKTSVSHILKHIFDTLHIPSELVGTLNSSSFSAKRPLGEANFTTPHPEELYPMLRRMADAGVELVIMEASSHALAQERLAPIKFEAGAFTNLSEDHLDYHGTMENYFAAKLSLFEKCKLGVINTDGEYGERMAREAECRTITCSTHKAADYTATQKRSGREGISYVLGTQTGGMLVSSRLCGEFQIANTMQAIAIATELGYDGQKVAETVKTVENIPGRLEALPIPEGCGFSVLVDYAHTPDALERALRSVRKMTPSGRVIVLFGCGGDREREKRPKMCRIAEKYADLCIVTGDNPRSESPSRIIKDILSGAGEDALPNVIPDRKNAILFAIAIARVGDTVLLAGKGHENYEIRADGTYPLDEREIVRKTIEKLYGRRE